MDGDERGVLAWAEGVERLRDQFLAGAAFALDQDRGAARRDLPDAVVDLDHGRRVADEIFQSELLVELLAQLPVLGLDLARMERTHEDRLQLLEVERLGDVIVRAALHRLHGDLLGAVGGHENRHGRTRNRLRLAQHVEPFRAAHQPQVGQQHVDRLRLEHVHRRGNVGREIDVELALEIAAQAVARVLFVLDHEERGKVVGDRTHDALPLVLLLGRAVSPGPSSRTRRSASGRRIRAVVPRPGSLSSSR